jgi:telomeric repeat-binding factor 2
MSLQWDDSPEGMTNDASRLHLPSPKRKLVSPLKKHEVTKLARRRQIKRWSLLEEDTLRTAVQKYVLVLILRKHLTRIYF